MPWNNLPLPANLSMLQSLTKNNKSSTPDTNQSSADQRTFDYAIAVTEQTMDEIKKGLPLMYIHRSSGEVREEETKDRKRITPTIAMVDLWERVSTWSHIGMLSRSEHP